MFQGFWLFLVVTRTNFSIEEPTPSTEAQGNLLLLLLFQDCREDKINACNICLWCSKRKCLLPNTPFEKQTITKPTKKRAKKHKKPKKNSTQKEGKKAQKKKAKKKRAQTSFVWKKFPITLNLPVVFMINLSRLY